MKKNNHQQSIINACKKIAPLWSLDNFVAVNPYLGFLDQTFEKTASLFKKAAATNLVMPLEFYHQQYKTGIISDQHLQLAIDKLQKNEFWTIETLVQSLSKKEEQELDSNITLVMDISETLTNTVWKDFITDRITNWASAFFDKGQALWVTTDQKKNVFQSWLEDAKVDKSPEIAGLKKFRKNLFLLPSSTDEAIEFILKKLDIPHEGLDTYLFSLLMRVSGWASYCAGIDWQLNLSGDTGTNTKDFLAILLAWEWNLIASSDDNKTLAYWNEFKEKLNNLNYTKNSTLDVQLIFQLAYEYRLQEELISKINSQKKNTHPKVAEITAQAVFCIDVRSEVFRRNLEIVDHQIATKGFAGFFGMPVEHFPLAQEKGENQCPVLLHPSYVVKDTLPSKKKLRSAENSVLNKEQFYSAFKLFKNGAISGFGFVSSMGITYVQKLIRDTFAVNTPWVENKPKTDTELYLNISLEEQVQLGASALKTMSLTNNFSRFILLIGHGSTSVNNPHASGLDCGACGGRTGEVNAKVAASILNDPAVRSELSKKGIAIPDDTIFIAGLHDTTTDTVTFFEHNSLSQEAVLQLDKLKISFQKAGQMARTERSNRFNLNGEKSNGNNVLSRGKDWSQIRPEWGLAGCNAFVIAPRLRTASVSLDSKSFLHDYSWKEDRGFKVLTTIMTAPMIVTSWINLQYYASTVDNTKMGAGNKTLHNVVGGFGVIEGQAGDLRVGLPMQSVHDGKQYQNLPSKLNVIIEAPKEAINQIIEANKMVQDLCDNNWIHLLAMNNEGKITDRYSGKSSWSSLELNVTA